MLGALELGGIAIEPTAIHPDAPLQDKLKELAVTWDTTRTSKLENKQQSILWDKPEPKKKAE